MKKTNAQSLRLLLLAGLLAFGLLPAFAWATPITTLFNVNGTCEYLSSGAPCAFSGTIRVDTSIGTLTAVDILFPSAGISPFTTITRSDLVYAGKWEFAATNSSGNVLGLDFTPTNPTSLVDYAGGPITGYTVLAVGGSFWLGDFGGSITPASVAVPEPAELGMFGLGLLLIGAFISLRQRAGHRFDKEAMA